MCAWSAASANTMVGGQLLRSNSARQKVLLYILEFNPNVTYIIKSRSARQKKQGCTTPSFPCCRCHRCFFLPAFCSRRDPPFSKSKPAARFNATYIIHGNPVRKARGGGRAKGGTLFHVFRVILLLDQRSFGVTGGAQHKGR